MGGQPDRMVLWLLVHLFGTTRFVSTEEYAADLLRPGGAHFLLQKGGVITPPSFAFVEW